MFKLRAVVIAIGVASTMAHAAEKQAATATTAREPVWTLTGHAYRVLSPNTFFEAIDHASRADVKAVEGRPYQISAETGDAELGPSAPVEALEKTRRKLKDAGLKLVSYYAGNFGKDEAEMRRLFEFGKSMGIEVFVGEPTPQKLPALDKLANEFGISVAIHNHPKRPKQSAYAYWDPAVIMKMVEKYSKRIGCCADTGHWVRSGLDPVACLKRYEGRLLYLHLNDVSEKGPQGHDVIMGTGVADGRGMLAELHRQKFSGQISFEYQNNVKDRPADVRKNAEYVRKIARELGQKVQ